MVSAGFMLQFRPAWKSDLGAGSDITLNKISFVPSPSWETDLDTSGKSLLCFLLDIMQQLDIS